ncbi:biotin biosynthesis protein BioC [Legionella massiliensis]|uniref:Biotin biosynthesis protein BioC n=1 Tax=Legionella massiliensis TaxID=1034943 RepID=A0A078KZE8_9GAMM|nr:class I SAM-dependent methyltransferase [Legionella massiliensis]CDZ77159.1 biotin biosynthesis protein BioC [Legionella massiliensis]CEE12897.1 Trans-aconitate 2-methyltransferase [Legionella massiliensis]
MTVSRSEVVYGFQFILGRPPESEKTIIEHMECADLQQLKQRLLNSQEYQLKSATHPSDFPPLSYAPPVNLNSKYLAKIKGIWAKKGRQPKQEPEHQPASLAFQLLPLNLPINDIEIKVTAETLQECLEKIKQTWSAFGQERPFWSVITSSDFLPENIDKKAELFWQSGKTEWQVIKTIAERHNFAITPSLTAVEFGCGVGRVTTEMAQHLKTVHGYDISANHLSIAAERAKSLGLTNLVLHELMSAKDLLQKLTSCDLFYSCLVFQHNPPPIINELVKLALDSLNPGGLAIFQVPTYISGYSFKARAWIDGSNHADMGMHPIPQHRIFEIAKNLNCEILEVREDNCTGDLTRFISNTFVIRKMK